MVLSMVATALVPRVPQDRAYHDFADRRPLGSIPNAADVLSNLAFLGAGLLGLARLRSSRRGAGVGSVDPRERWPYVVFFGGVTLTAAGSAYYHLAPTNARLVWDRLPMTVAFTGLFAGVVAQRISPRLGIALLPLLVGAGIASVIYWDVTERAGAGDLRPYGLVQFGLMLLLVVVTWLWPAAPGGGGLGLVLLVYGLSKGFELLDGQIWAWGGIVSGHTLKHLTAALAAALVLRPLAGPSP